MDGFLDLLGITLAPVVGVFGVWLGAKTQGDRDERRLEREEVIARENRLFDHRRTAYAEFLKTARNLYQATYLHTHGHPWHDQAPDDDSYDPVVDAAEEVGVYGSEDIAACAREIAQDITLYGLL